MKKLFSVIISVTLFCSLICFSACDSNNGHTHSYLDSVVSPNCCEEGYTLHTCSCGEEYLDNFTAIDENAHIFNGKICSKCGLNIDEEIFEYELTGGEDEYIVVGLKDKSFSKLALPKTYKGLPVIEISDYAFLNCNKLIAIIIPDGIRRIGIGAFSNCSGLEEVNLPNSVTEISDEAFSNCTGLEKFTVPDSVIVIGENAFLDCTEIATITVGTGVNAIGKRAFDGCTGLSTMYFNDTTTWYYTPDFREWESKSNGTQISTSSITKSAIYFKTTHCNDYWYKV